VKQLWLSVLKTAGTEIAVSLLNYHNNFSLAVSVPGEAAITVMCFDIGGLEVPPKTSSSRSRR
jgi:hypothetical protein